MLNEQQKLLYNITKNRVNNFYLNMKDHLSIDDYTKMNEYTSNIYKLEQQYIKQYGELPIWNSIDDVMNTYDELNNLLKDGNKMIIDYNNKLDTSIKYEPLIFHLFVIDNSLTLKIESQDNRLRGKHIAVVRYQKDDNKYNQIDISSASCCEIAYHDFYLLGEEKYDNDVYSFNFKDTKEVLTYIKDLLEIFKNINIFDTFIYIHNVNTNGLTTQKYFNGEKIHKLLENTKKDLQIEDLDFSVRSYNCCKRAGYNYLADFEGKTKYDLMRIKNLGKKNMEEVISICKKHGIVIQDDE